jgi:hypothetical protein
MDVRKSGFSKIFREKTQFSTVIYNERDNELIAGDQQGNILIYDLVGD